MKRILAGLGLVLCLNGGLAEDGTKNTRIVCNDEKIESIFKDRARNVYGSGADHIICEWLDTKEFSAKCVLSSSNGDPRGISIYLHFDFEFSGSLIEYSSIARSDKSIADALDKEFLPIIEKHYSSFLKKKFEEGKCKEIKLGD